MANRIIIKNFVNYKVLGKIYKILLTCDSKPLKVILIYGHNVLAYRMDFYDKTVR